MVGDAKGEEKRKMYFSLPCTSGALCLKLAVMPVVQAIAVTPVWNIQSIFRGSNLLDWNEKFMPSLQRSTDSCPFIAK